MPDGFDGYLALPANRQLTLGPISSSLATAASLRFIFSSTSCHELELYRAKVIVLMRRNSVLMLASPNNLGANFTAWPNYQSMFAALSIS